MYNIYIFGGKRRDILTICQNQTLFPNEINYTNNKI